MATEIITINPFDFNPQEYTSQDINLVTNFNINTILTSASYIEYTVYNTSKEIITTDYNFSQYTILNDGSYFSNNEGISQIELDPSQSLLNLGLDTGQYVIYYNFLDKKVGSNLEQLYISEISNDRTELRLDSTSLDELTLIEQTNNFIQEREESNYFVDFYLNFGDNNLILANNIDLDTQDINNPTILIKLYEPLPDEFDINSTLWVVTSFEDPIAYQVTFEDEIIPFNDTLPIQGPNFNLDLKDQVNNSTVELSYIDLISTSLTSSQQQLNSLLEEKEIDINVDYTDFSEYVHFSSAETRLRNFYYKIQLIEQYSSSISILNNTVNSDISGSISIYQSKIDNIITNFDGYDYFLYYENNSYTWPKTTSQKPYELAKSDSVTVLSWIGSTNESSPYYGGLLLSASIYDNENSDNLLYSIPEYLRDDPDNAQYELFVQMVAQFYDNIWIYYKDVTEKYNADNRLEYGVSKDIVADAIRDFGVKLYQNNFSNDDLYTAFLGLTPEGGLFPFPNITGSLPTPSGYEYIDQFISASNDYMPLDDVNKSLYKRIYHNLPYLLKSKGTLPGLRALITSYGIPDTILRINEYGGKDKINSNDWDYWQDEFNYSFYTTGSNFISSSWELNPNWAVNDNIPATVVFRFKTEGLPSSNIPYSQSLWNKENEVHLVLRYTGSAYASGSYSGSIIDPYYQYAHLDLYPNYTTAPNESASVYLPFFNGEWWSVMAKRDGTTSYFTLSAGNNIYENGENGASLGFYSSSVITASTDVDWYNTVGNSYFATSSIINGNIYNQFSGSLQEIRYYGVSLNEDVFKDYIMNPYSTEGNSLNSSPNELVFRAPLGGELYTGSISIHPKITGSWISTGSFISNSNFYFDQTPTFLPNTEYFFYDQPIAGIRNTISDKIRIENNVIPEGDTLSPFMSLSQMANISQSYTPNTNYLEVAFSPTNEINEDIMDQIGSFNIGEYIGDPRLRSSSAVTYPALDQLRSEYFQKYTSNYNLTDFIRLIKFFDNSLFKMIRDFVPARTSLASGIVIKQHLLERNKYPQPQLNWESLDISGTLKPTWNGYEEGTVENFSGGTGGVFNSFNLVTNTSQSWIENINTPSGSVLVIHASQDEFYNGEFSGSVLLVSNGILNEAYPIDTQAFDYKQVHYYGISSSSESLIFENNFLNNITSPQDGEILFFNQSTAKLLPLPVTVTRNTKYIKIAKIDCNGNDNTIALGDINKALIYNPLLSSYAQYDLLVLNEQSNYYLYQVDPLVSYTPSLFPNQVLDYTVSASIISPYTFSNPTSSVFFQLTESIDALNLYNSSSGLITFNNTPNTPIIITASITLSTNNSPQFGSFSLIKGNTSPISGNSTEINSNITITNIPTTFTISGALYPIKGESFYLNYTIGSGGSPFTNTITNVQLLLTQSRAVSASSCEPVIFEPYITTPNFYNSDENALLNNAFELRDSSYYMDVDYTRGITEPVNFSLLISGSASRAKVQDSNYTSKRVIIPRYEGSKSTSQFLNVWTKGDTGTYGKLPTIESSKVYVAYGEMGGSWAPERMNASTFQIKYLIKEDGTVDIPNTSENSLQNVQGTFQSGERFKISSAIPGGGEATEYRTIIRGGTRIEPILYNQSGSAPNAQWTDTITLTDNYNPGGVIGDYQAKLYPSSFSINPITPNAWQEVKFNQTSSLGNDATLITVAMNTARYRINPNLINDGVSLTINVNLRASNTDGYENIYENASYQARIVRWRGGDKTQLSIGPTTGIDFDYSLATVSTSIPFDQLQENDEIAIETYLSPATTGGTTVYIESTSTLVFNQSPLSNSTINTSGLWVSSSGNTTTTIQSFGFSNPYILYTTASALVNFYENPNTFQENISSSGFNPVSLPWLLKYGDEFRFEGREDRVYTVVKIDRINSGSDFILAIELDKPLLAKSGSVSPTYTGSVIDYDHFLIRRYVDDASQVLFEGFKPTNSQGPYIITPEYVTPSLNQNADTFITNLTERGLL